LGQLALLNKRQLHNFRGAFACRNAAAKIRFDTAAKVRQPVRELTARFPPLIWEKSRARSGGNHSILNQSSRSASNGDGFGDDCRRKATGIPGSSEI
jgi:hypothetical protein